MKYFLIILFLLSSNCSLNQNSQYWKENNFKNTKNYIKNNTKKPKVISDEVLSRILKKSNNITSMSLEEFQIYIDQNAKKSKYPELNK
jgi:fructose-1,6-bisphosphatase